MVGFGRDREPETHVEGIFYSLNPTQKQIDVLRLPVRASQVCLSSDSSMLCESICGRL
jgi:hypothetical protein